MSTSLRFLVAESETAADREARRQREGRSSGESYLDTLRSLAPNASFDLVRPAEPDSALPDALAAYAGVFLTGSPLHLYEDTPAVRRQLAFMRAVFASGTPSFGSCAGLQVATVAAGGTVRPIRNGHELAIARRITPTAAGACHPMLRGRAAAYDALTIHADEVETLPPEASVLATNGITAVQAAEIRHEGGVFWGVQYHPELPPEEIAGALRSQAKTAVSWGLARSEAVVEEVAARIAELGADPGRADLAWLLGVDAQVADPVLRTIELRNFLACLAGPRCNRRVLEPLA